jgi:hypothetical protein
MHSAAFGDQPVFLSVRKVTPRTAVFGKFKGQVPAYRDCGDGRRI